MLTDAVDAKSVEEVESHEPLRRFDVVRNGDVTSMELGVGRWHTEPRIVVENLTSGGDRRFSLAATSVGPITLVRTETKGGSSQVHLREPEAEYAFSIALKGGIRFSIGEEQVVATGSRAVVFGPGASPSLEVTAGTRHLGVSIQRAALDQCLSEMVGGPVSRPIRFRADVDLMQPTLDSWTRGLRHLVLDLDDPHGLAAIEAGHEAWATFLMRSLLVAWPHDYSEALERRRRPAFIPRGLRLAMDAIDADPSEDYSPLTLSAIAGVSVRTLQQHFHDYVGRSPREHLQWVRLGRVHDDLVAGRGDTVSDIAYRWGFRHLSRFASAYQERYGMSPSRALRRS